MCLKNYENVLIMIRKLLYKAFAVLGGNEVKAFDLASRNCQQAQTERLLEIISPNVATEFGVKHGFAKIKSVKDFQNAVPILNYDDLSPLIERMAAGEQNILTAEAPYMFATTSGTTGARKLIPVNSLYMKEFRRASVISGFNLLRNFPKLSNGVALTIFSSAEEGRTSGNIPYGAISGKLYQTEPKLIKKFVSPIPYEVFLIKDYEARYYTLLRCALMLPIACIYTLNPSTIALLGRRLKTYGEKLLKDISDGTLTAPGAVPPEVREAIKHFLVADPHRARRLAKHCQGGDLEAAQVWPTLTMISCWTKAAAAFYLKDLPELYGDVPICDITYGASEGRGTVGVSIQDQALAIRSHFFEFVEVDDMDKENPPVLTAAEVEVGKSYYILFTTSAGLCRYNLNDIVKIVGRYDTTPLIEFQHKGGNISSFTGEKLTESQVTEAVKATTAKLGIETRFFSVLPQFRPEPHYELYIETARTLSHDEISLCAQRLDLELNIANSEYETKRQSQRLAAPTVHLLAPGTYEKIRKELVDSGVPDAQIKISHLNPKSEVKELILAKALVLS